MKGNMLHAVTVTGVLTKATRMRNTFSGNAQWKLTVNGYTFKTYPDGAKVSTTNFDDLVQTEISLRLNDHMRVIDYFTPRTLGVGSLVHLARHLEQLPIGSKVQLLTGNHPEYIKRQPWQWDCGAVSLNPEMLLMQAKRLRVTRIGETE